MYVAQSVRFAALRSLEVECNWPKEEKGWRWSEEIVRKSVTESLSELITAVAANGKLEVVDA